MLNRLRKDSGEKMWDHNSLIGLVGFNAKKKVKKQTKARDEVVSVLYWYLFHTAEAAPGAGTGGARVSPSELLEYPLADGGCPALFNEGDGPDQAMRKSTKTDWSSAAVGEPVSPPSLQPDRSGMSVDLMAYSRAVGPAWKRKSKVTFGTISEKIAGGVVSRAVRNKCGFLTVAVDVHGAPGSRLLKDSAAQRGESRVKVVGAQHDHSVASKASWHDHLRSDVHKNEWSKTLPKAFSAVLKR